MTAAFAHTLVVCSLWVSVSAAQPTAAPHPGAAHLLNAEVGVLVPLVERHEFTYRVGGGVSMRALWGVSPHAALGLRVTTHLTLIPHTAQHDDGTFIPDSDYRGPVADKVVLLPALGMAVAAMPAEWFAVHGTIGSGHVAEFADAPINDFLQLWSPYPLAGLALDFVPYRSEYAELHLGAEADVFFIWWRELPVVFPRGVIGVGF